MELEDGGCSQLLVHWTYSWRDKASSRKADTLSLLAVSLHCSWTTVIQRVLIMLNLRRFRGKVLFYRIQQYYFYMSSFYVVFALSYLICLHAYSVYGCNIASFVVFFFSSIFLGWPLVSLWVLRHQFLFFQPNRSFSSLLNCSSFLYLFLSCKTKQRW